MTESKGSSLTGNVKSQVESRGEKRPSGESRKSGEFSRKDNSSIFDLSTVTSDCTKYNVVCYPFFPSNNILK